MTIIGKRKAKSKKLSIHILCSKAFYKKVPLIKKELEEMGFEVVLPNCYDRPTMENEMHLKGQKEHSEFKKKMYKQSAENIGKVDAVLVLNFTKLQSTRMLENYIGGATFLEMYEACIQGKKIFLYNPIPLGILCDEICGFDPIVVGGDLQKIKEEMYK